MTIDRDPHGPYIEAVTAAMIGTCTPSRVGKPAFPSGRRSRPNRSWRW